MLVCAVQKTDHRAHAYPCSRLPDLQLLESHYLKTMMADYLYLHNTTNIIIIGYSFLKQHHVEDKILTDDCGHQQNLFRFMNAKKIKPVG